MMLLDVGDTGGEVVDRLLGTRCTVLCCAVLVDGKVIVR